MQSVLYIESKHFFTYVIRKEQDMIHAHIVTYMRYNSKMKYTHMYLCEYGELIITDYYICYPVLSKACFKPCKEFLRSL